MSSIDWTRPQLLDCDIQPYAWGCVGPDAYLAKLKGIEKPVAPMAELWMGAHPKSPSKIHGQGLDELLKSSAETIMGPELHQQYGHGLPYLFKVLSANDALSIQLHPSKKEAEELHQRDPKNYPDDNHKPEIAIALEGGLEALLGFESCENILKNIETHPELNEFIGPESLESLKKANAEDDHAKAGEIKRIFTGLFQKSIEEKELLKTLTDRMASRLAQQNDLEPKLQWFVDLQKTYPEGDVGLFCLFFLNYRRLEAGQGVFLKADVPHAYLKGNIIECMANSDNVVRAGLTPKFVDVETLSKIVLVECEALQTQQAEDNGLEGGVFKVPVPEFEVHHWKSSDHGLNINMAKLNGPRMFVIINGSISASAEGSSFEAKKGDVVFLADACSSQVTLAANSEIYLARPAD